MPLVKAADAGQGATFSGSLDRFHKVLAWLEGDRAATLSHGELEEQLQVDARELPVPEDPAVGQDPDPGQDRRTDRGVAPPVPGDGGGDGAGLAAELRGAGGCLAIGRRSQLPTWLWRVGLKPGCAGTA